MNKKTNLIWIDLEMTGLVPERDVIIEIATVVTDADLNVLAEGPSIAIHQSDDYLNNMDEWNTSHHSKSGLIKKFSKAKIFSFDTETTSLDAINAK